MSKALETKKFSVKLLFVGSVSPHILRIQNELLKKKIIIISPSATAPHQHREHLTGADSQPVVSDCGWAELLSDYI